MKTDRIFKAFVFAALLGITFISLIIGIFYITYKEFDLRILTDFYFAIMLIGVVPSIINMRLYGIVFLSGATIGFITDCVMSNLQTTEPNMSAGIYNLQILCVSFVVALVVQILQMKKRKKILNNKIKKL